MNLEYIREFVTLAQVGRFQDAAEQLYISQPTLSKHIKKLEEDLGEPLLMRAKKRRLQLTEFGRIFLPYALRLSETYNDFQQEYKALSTRHSQHLSIGLVPMVIPITIMRYLDTYLGRHPEFTFDFFRDNPGQLIRGLSDGTYDFIIIPDLYPEEQSALLKKFRSVSYIRDSLVAMLPLSHPCAKHEYITLSELTKDRIIFFKNSGVLALTQQLSISEDVPIRESINVEYPSEIIELVEGGFGVSIMGLHSARFHAKDRLALVPLKPEINVEYILLLPGTGDIPEVTQGLINVIKDLPAER